MPTQPMLHLIQIILAATAVSRINATSTTSSSTVVSPTTPATAFFWSTQNDSMLAVPQCSTLRITTSGNDGSSVNPVSPYFFTAAGENLVPEIQKTSSAIGSTFQWVANFPVGTQFSLAMTDSANNSGGLVGGYSIVAGTSNCTLASNSTSVSFSIDPSNNPCDQIKIDARGGTKPYTVSLIAPGLGRYANATGFTTDSFILGNTVPAGQAFNLFVTDARGIASTVSAGMTSGLGQSNCQKPGSSSSSGSSSSLGPIVGGVVGGILVALAIILIAYWYFRKKQRQKAEAAHRQELNSADYRLADGTAPKITPFVLPPRVSDGGVRSPNNGEYSMVPSSSEHSPYREDTPASSAYGNPPYGSNAPSSYAPASSVYSPSSYGNPTPQPPQAHYAPPPPPPSSTSPSQYTGGGTGTYESSAVQSASERDRTDARTGLANPDDFEYRIPEHNGGYHGQGSDSQIHLPLPGSAGVNAGWSQDRY
ncbi:hypothetical protein T439DRAFT_378201 [Meredithblackwellia eburnea MCA 4105]